jgi:small-conductance mechanosensitive channel
MIFDPGSASNMALLAVILIGVAGIVAWHLIPRRLANARMLSQIGFFMAMSALLTTAKVVPYEPTQANADAAYVLVAGIAKALWWTHLAWAPIGLARIYLVIERKPREARLLQDLVVGVVYVAIALSILAFVFSLPVGTLIATSGVLAIVLGLALQNTLSDVFSGIALNLGRPYALGDWIVLGDGTEGRVVETDWRSTHLVTLSHNVVALPNSLLAKIGITNVSRPDASHSLSITVRNGANGNACVRCRRHAQRVAQLQFHSTGTIAGRNHKEFGLDRDRTRTVIPRHQRQPKSCGKQRDIRSRLPPCAVCGAAAGGASNIAYDAE